MQIVREMMTEGPLRRYRVALVVLVQLAIVAASYVGSFILLWDFAPDQVPWSLVLKSLPTIIVLRLGALALFRLHQGLWRYVSVPDLAKIIKATTLSSAAFAAIGIPIFGFQDFHGSVALLDWILNIFLLSGIRLFVRMLREQFSPVKGLSRSFARLLIIGAGDAGAELCRQALSSRSFRLNPVAFVDDDFSKVGTSIFGVAN